MRRPWSIVHASVAVAALSILAAGCHGAPPATPAPTATASSTKPVAKGWSRQEIGVGSVRAVAVDPRGNGALYAATIEGVFKSTNGGAQWRRASEGLAQNDSRSLAIDPTNPDVVWVGAFNGTLSKSDDAAAHWKLTNTPATRTPVAIRAIVIDPKQSSTVYAARPKSGVLRTTDGGTTWVELAEGLTNLDVRALAIDPLTPATVYAGTNGGGVFKTSDGGTTWRASNQGLPNLVTRAIAIDPKNPQILYAATTGFGLFKSTDAAATWSVVGKGLAPQVIWSLAVDPVNPQIVWVGAASGWMSKSSDGGATWTTSKPDTRRPVWHLAIDPAQPKNVYAATSGDAVFKSTGE